MPLTRLRPRTDEQLVAAFRAGDDRAFERIHDRYRDRLDGFVRQMLRHDPHTAEDVVQDVWVRAFRALRADARPMTLRPWLYRIAHNRTMDVLRAAGPVRSEIPEELPAPTPGTATRVERPERLPEF